MNFSVLKLKFSTPLHIGESKSARSLDTSVMTLCADTLFSALCHTAFAEEGESGIKKLYELATQNRLRISDAMPYFNDGENGDEDRLYIPKPIMPFDESILENRKKMKKINYIPVDMLPDFIDFAKNNKDSFEITQEDFPEFGKQYVLDKASIDRNNGTAPYSVGLFSFYENAGLYFIIGFEDENELSYIIRLLKIAGIGGIGGKVSSGYGKYEIIDEFYLDDCWDQQTEILIEMLHKKDFKHSLLLTSSLPTDDELDEALEGSTYNLIRRGGYIQSTGYQQPLKKQTQHFFAAGSVFLNRFEGDVYDVSRGAGHPVYRYSKPIFLGVDTNESIGTP
ncbi:MAG: CRISPR-associated protein Csm4 family [Oscillospiraceae bacterium]|nr:CRISPR-associated protein Csm4 family [Oscillospiraceae bacterium]